LKRYSFTLALALFWVATNAQKTYIAQTDVGTLLSTSNQVPFWQQANIFGAAPHTAPALTGRFRLFSQPIALTDSAGKRRWVDWNFGVDAVGNAAAKSNVALIEAYFEVRIGAFIVEAGRKREVIGLLDTLLTTGAVSYSGNALPIPKVQIATNGFVEIPFTKQMLAFQGTFAHGWMEDMRISPTFFPRPNGTLDYYGHYLNTYFHQKSFYGRLGKPTWKVNLYGGFNDSAFWGNETTIWNPNFQLSLLESYRRVVTGINWESSKVGNHFGTIDLALNIKGRKWDTFLYRQSIFDTGSLLNALNIDALNGIRLRNKNAMNNQKWYIRSLLAEFLYTNDQRDPLVSSGRNSYFNHYIYLDGWSYQGRGLGTPFVSTLDRKPDSDEFFMNNRIMALHLGAEGCYNQKYSFVTKLSYSHNKGTYGVPFTKPKNQLSSFVSVSKPLAFWGGSVGKLSLAADVGELYPVQVAVQASLLKTWHF
jgi:Capsule assembly protein Wzi